MLRRDWGLRLYSRRLDVRRLSKLCSEGSHVFASLGSGVWACRYTIARDNLVKHLLPEVISQTASITRGQSAEAVLVRLHAAVAHVGFINFKLLLIALIQAAVYSLVSGLSFFHAL